MVANADLGNCKEKWVCCTIYIKCNSDLCKEGINHYMYFLKFDGIKKVPHAGLSEVKTFIMGFIRLLKFEQFITKPYEISDTYLFSYLFQQV